MKKFFDKLMPVLLFAALIRATACNSAGGETPSTEIPAPVSHLSASSPDSDGLVRITAEADFTDGGTTVTITNTNAVSKSLWDFFVRPAYAHATHTVTSNTDGSFQETIEGATGDVLTVTYTKDSTEESTSATVPVDTPSLPTTANIQDVSIDPTRDKALIVANNGTDGFVHIVDLTDKAYESTINLPGASGASRIATDSTTGETIVLDTENVTAIHITLDGGGSVVSTTDIIPSSDLAAGPAGNYVIISHDSSPAMSFFDLSTDSGAAGGDSENEEGTDQQTSAFAAADFDGTNDKAFILSQMPDESFILTSHLVDETAPSITQDGVVTLSDLSLPGGLFVFNLGTEALLTDVVGGSVLRVALGDGSTTRIEVGADPSGVVVDETSDIAYVVNNGDRNVSAISLADDTITDTVEVGLSPTEAAVNPSGVSPSVIVINTGDETISLID